MRLKEMQAVLAESLGRDEGSIRTLGEKLRAAKLLTTGPRGPGAPHMSPDDGANHLIAPMAAEVALHAVEVVNIYRRLRVRPTTRKIEIPFFEFLGAKNLDFGTALAGLLLFAQEGSLRKLMAAFNPPDLPDGADMMGLSFGMTVEVSFPAPNASIRFWIINKNYEKEFPLNLDFIVYADDLSNPAYAVFNQSGDLVTRRSISEKTILRLGEAFRR